MKKLNLLTLSFITLLFALFITACSDDDDTPRWYDSVPNGEPFSIGTSVKIYYVDEEGNGLINPEDLSTLPVVCRENKIAPQTPSDYDNGWYCDYQEHVLWDEELEMYAYSPKCLGDSRQSSYTFYIWFGGEFDKMDMRYNYTPIGDMWGTQISSWKFNGTHIYSTYGNEIRNIFVHKLGGNTVVNNSRYVIYIED